MSRHYQPSLRTWHLVEFPWKNLIFQIASFFVHNIYIYNIHICACVYIYIYVRIIYMYVCICLYIYIYMHIDVTGFTPDSAGPPDGLSSLLSHLGSFREAADAALAAKLQNAGLSGSVQLGASICLRLCKNKQKTFA